MCRLRQFYNFAACVVHLVVLLSTVASAGDSVEIASGLAPHHPQQPQLAVDAEGTVHLVYGVGDLVRYCRSDDGGKSFAKPVDLPATHTIALGMRRGPRIAVTEKAICVSVIGGKQGKGRDGDVLSMRSTDGGTTWSNPILVNDAVNSAREGLHAMAARPRGEIACVWLDLRNRKTEVMAAASADSGRTWSKNVLVYKSPQGSVCECCHPSVVFDSQGRVVVQWRNSLDGNRDMYVTQSTDGGKSFGKAVRLGTGSWTLNACPMDGGSIAALPNGKLASVWRRDKTVYLSLAGQDKEQPLGEGEQPSIAASEKGPYIVWLTKRGAAAQLLAPGRSSAVELSSHASDPVVAAGPNGHGPVAVVWESRRGQHHTIQFQVIGP